MGAAQSQRLEIDGATLRGLVKVVGLEDGALSESVAAEVADFLKVQALDISNGALGASDKVPSAFAHASPDVALDQYGLQQLLREFPVELLLFKPLMYEKLHRIGPCDEAEMLLQLIAAARQVEGSRGAFAAGLEAALGPMMQIFGEEGVSIPQSDIISVLLWILTHCLLIQVSHMLSKGGKLELHDFQLAIFISFDVVPPKRQRHKTTKQVASILKSSCRTFSTQVMAATCL